MKKTYDDSPKKSRPWLIAIPTVLIVLLGIIWSGFWYWASNKAEAAMMTWRSHEASAGRLYDCASTAFSGYPFRIVVDCAEPSVDDRATSLSIKAHSLAAVAQVWDPTLVIGEVTAPLTVGPLGGAPTVTMNWTLAQASLRGTPGAPERLAVVVDKPNATASTGEPVAAADHMELHGRFNPDDHAAIDLAFDVKHGTAPALAASLGNLGPLVSAGADLQIVGVLRGVSELRMKPLVQQLREIQAAHGALEISSARLQQSDLIAGANGILTLTERGTLSGNMKVTVVNLPRLIQMLGIDRALGKAVPQEAINHYAPALDRLVPGLGIALRGRDGGASGGGGAVALATAGAAMLGGQQTEFEGRQAVTMTLRFEDGTAYLGPLKVAQIPPLY